METHRNTTATVRAVLAAAQDAGVQPTDLLSEAGISNDLASDPDGEVSLATMQTFWQSAYRLSGDPYLAIHAGLKAAHGSYKTLDYLLISATTLGEGVSQFIEHFRLINTWLNFAFEEEHDQFHLTLRSKIGPVPFPAVEITFTAITERARRILGSDWSPKAIEFLHSPQGDRAFYDGFFRCPVAFAAENARMTLSREQYETPLPTGDAGLYRVLMSHAERLSSERPAPDDLVARTRSEILRVLRDGPPTIETIAGALGLGSRTMQRRLSERGEVFSKLVDRVREDQARDLVAGQAMALNEIAFFLGFADQSAFSRAFKRWTGQTPKAFRKDA